MNTEDAEVNENVDLDDVYKGSKKNTCQSNCYTNKSDLGYLCKKEDTKKNVNGEEIDWCKISINDYKKFKHSSFDYNQKPYLVKNKHKKKYYWDKISQQPEKNGYCYGDVKFNQQNPKSPIFDYISKYKIIECSDENFSVYKNNEIKLLNGITFNKFLITIIGMKSIENITNFIKKYNPDKSATTNVGLYIGEPIANIVAPSHLNSKMKLGQLNNIDLVREAINRYKEFLLQLPKNLISDMEAEKITNNLLTEFNNKIQETPPENHDEITGQYIKHALNGVKKYDKLFIDNTVKGNNIDFSTHVKNPESLIDFIIREIPNENVLNVLRGANCIVDDTGKLYNFAKKNFNYFVRFSSHALIQGIPTSSKTQLGITD